MPYHDRTYQLLGTTVTHDPVNISQLSAVEQHLGIPLPESVREWYGRQDAIALLRYHSNDDPPIEPANFQLVHWRSQLLLPIRYENQGVCTWALSLHGSADPPVLVDVDTNGQNWTPFADSFADYVYSNVWDSQMVFRQPALVQAQNPPLSAGATSALGQSFDQAVTTHGWPGGVRYRFGSRSAAILIWSNEDQADWFAAAPSADHLQRLVQSISHLDSVGGAFYECSDAGAVALAQIKASQP